MPGGRFHTRRTRYNPSGEQELIYDTTPPHAGDPPNVTRGVFHEAGQPLHYHAELVRKAGKRYKAQAHDRLNGTWVGMWAPVDEEGMRAWFPNGEDDATIWDVRQREPFHTVDNEGAGFPDLITAAEATRRDLMAQPDDESE